MTGLIDAIIDMIINRILVIIGVIVIVVWGFATWKGEAAPKPLTSQELELRLLNLEELHTVTINNKVLSVEHVDIPTSSTVTYVKIPMNEWVKYEHLFGR